MYMNSFIQVVICVAINHVILIVIGALGGVLQCCTIWAIFSPGCMV